MASFTGSRRPAASKTGESASVPMSWRRCVRRWYPDLLTRTYFLPHVYMHRTLHKTWLISGIDVAVPQPPVRTQHLGGGRTLTESDVREDTSHEHILHCVRRKAAKHNDVMFVLSQLNFGDFLSKPTYAAAASQLPRPVDLKSRNFHRGDFDILFLHRLYGLLVAEVKSVGASADDRGLSEDQLVDEVLHTLKKMLKLDKKPKQDSNGTTTHIAGQLEKEKHVLSHLVADLKPTPRVRATLCLPNVSSHVLRKALEKSQDVKQALCRDLDLPLSADPVKFCLCSDQLSDRRASHDVTAEVMTKFCHWWDLCMTAAGPDRAMNDQVYENLVARFAGPATLVQIYCQREPRLEVTDMRTPGQFIADVGDRLTAVSLFPSQVALIHMAPDLAFLAGPPGTGKTLTIVVMALEWLRQGQHVHIVTASRYSRAASHLIKQQLEKTARHTPGEASAGRVHLHVVNFLQVEESFLAAEVDDLAKTLLAVAVDKQLCLVADELFGVKAGMEALYQQLASHSDVERVRLWAASIETRHRPACLPLHRMTEPLRCPPAVQRKVQEADHLYDGRVPVYTEPGVPLPCDGPPVLYVHHQGPGHTSAEWTLDCEACGLEIGMILGGLIPRDGQNTVRSGTSPRLHFRDVLILATDHPRDEVTDVSGHVVSPANGAIVGLRKAKVPVRVVIEEDDVSVAEVATMTGPDAVTVAAYDTLWGLERKVVVWMGGGEGVWGGLDEVWGRLYGMSRATAQLIWVRVERRGTGQSSDEDTDDHDGIDSVDDKEDGV